MKVDQIYLKGSILIIIGIVGLFLWQTIHSLTRDADISKKISSALDLLTTCNFEPEKAKYVHDILLKAQTAIDVDRNYDVASSLLNSLTGDLYLCKPTLQANPDLMIITLLAMFLAFGIITIIRHYREKPAIKEVEETTKKSRWLQLKEKLHKSKIVPKIPFLFTPVCTMALFPLIFIFFIPVLLLLISKSGFDIDISAYTWNSTIIITLLNGSTLYYLRYSPTVLLNKFKEKKYILNYNVMKYGFPTQLGFLIIIVVIMVLFNSSIKITSANEATLVFSSIVYFVMSVSLSSSLFTAVQFNSDYRFIMAKANCMVFTNSTNDLTKTKSLLHTIKYYNEFLRKNLKMYLAINTNIVTTFLTKDTTKKELSENLLKTFNDGRTKPLEFFLKLPLQKPNLLVVSGIRDILVTWSPLIVSVLSISAVLIQFFYEIRLPS